MCEAIQRTVVWILGAALIASLLLVGVCMWQKVPPPGVLEFTLGGCLTGLTAIFRHSPDAGAKVSGDVAGDVNVATPTEEPKA